jgi:hypothetical protein
MRIFVTYLKIEFLKLRYSKSFWVLIVGLLIFSMLVFIELRSTIYEKYQAISRARPDQDFVDFLLKRLAKRIQLIGYSELLLITMVSLEIDIKSLFVKNKMYTIPINIWLFSLCKAFTCSTITLLTLVLIFVFMPSFINNILTRYNYPMIELNYAEIILGNTPTLLLFFLLIAVFYTGFVIFFNFRVVVSSIAFVSAFFFANALRFHPIPLILEYNSIIPILVSVKDIFFLLALIIIMLISIQFFTPRNNV